MELVVPLVPPVVTKLPVAPAARAASELNVRAVEVTPVVNTEVTVPCPAVKVNAPMFCVSVPAAAEL